jgi:hypothetical protein
MEASDTSGQPPQEPGQTDATGQEQPSSQDAQPEQSEQPASSQEQADQDSQLTTPQADQPVPHEAERQDSAPEQPSPSEYQPKHVPLENAGLDQDAAEAERQAELAREREEHNRRTAGEQPQDDPLTSASDAPQDEA